MREISADFGPAQPHGGRQIEHLHPLGIDIHRCQQFFQLQDPSSGVGISFQEMALALQSPGHEDTVQPPFERVQHI